MEASLVSLANEAHLRWGIRPVEHSGKELHSGCPFCGEGVDRFIIWPAGNYWCRACGEKGFVAPKAKRGKAPDLEQLQAVEEDIRQREVAQMQGLEAWQAGYRSGYIDGWHAAMRGEDLEYWHKAGIPDWAIEKYKVGFCPDKPFEVQGKTFHSPAYTIPILDPKHQRYTNIQYRLLQVPEGAGKYRQEVGIPAASFYAEPVPEGGERLKSVLVPEGAKKAIVLYDRTGRSMQVVGLPGMKPHRRLIEALGVYRTIFLLLDPGAGRDGAAERIARILHPHDVRTVELPVKPDDGFNEYAMTKDLLRYYLEQARRL